MAHSFDGVLGRLDLLIICKLELPQHSVESCVLGDDLLGRESGFLAFGVLYLGWRRGVAGEEAQARLDTDLRVAGGGNESLLRAASDFL